MKIEGRKQWQKERKERIKERKKERKKEDTGRKKRKEGTHDKR